MKELYETAAAKTAVLTIAHLRPLPGALVSFLHAMTNTEPVRFSMSFLPSKERCNESSVHLPRHRVSQAQFARCPVVQLITADKT